MARSGTSKRGRGTRAPRNPVNETVMPDVYREMLADAVSSSPSKFDEEGQAVKRRRVGGRVVKQSYDEMANHLSDQASTDANYTDIERPRLESQAARKQTAYTESDDSADSDIDWQEVDLKDTPDKCLSEQDTVKDEELNLVLGAGDNDTRRQSVARRKPASAADKKLRLEIHKMHVLSLLVHVHRRNHWCNDEDSHKRLRKLLEKRTISYLNPDSQKTQFQRSRSFVDGLKQALDVFNGKYKIGSRGMSRSYWAESPEDLANTDLPEDLDLPIQKRDFRETASNLNASRDVGAQLFCALLRSVGVDARLVCSLQPLPFVAAAKVTTTQKSVPMMIITDPESRTATSGDESGIDQKSDVPVETSRAVGSIGGRNRFASPNHGHPRPVDNSNSNSNSTSTLKPPKPTPKTKRIKESPYPVYWVEAFDEATQKWIPVDPLVTKSVAKPSKLEPPASDPKNQLSYVVAFEDDGTARDVTRRYAKAYNAKTRKERVEVTNGGEKWWRRVMRMYRRDHILDRDQLEDAQLIQKEAQEGMPKNVQDFRDHPYYALERHLRRSEVIHPKREVGKVAAGRSGGDKILEPIYRRRDVHEVKSADKWYRMGREIKTGEQPLKRVTARRKRGSAFDEEQNSEDEENAGTGLYAAFQTTVYIAPPVINGRIPKNIYGNLDIYVPSMVPAGGVHITHPETARAAKILGIDFADAVTGFAFKGRHGTAITQGAVVATEYREAVEAVIEAFENERAEEEEARRSAEALRMWRRLLAGLRIRERIEGYEVEGERDALRERIEEADMEGVKDEEAGGFLPDRDAKGFAEPTAGRTFAHEFAGPEGDEGGGFIADNEEHRGGFMEDDEAESRDENTRRKHQLAADPFINTSEDDDRGGFYAYDIDEDAEKAMRETEPAELFDPYDSKDISRQGGGFLRDKVEESNDKVASFPTQNSPDEQGGGFLINDEEDTTRIHPQEQNEPQSTIPHPIFQNPETPPPSLHNPGLADNDLAEATMLQELHDSSQITTTIPSSNLSPPADAAKRQAEPFPAAHNEAIPHDTSSHTQSPSPPPSPPPHGDDKEPQAKSPASDPGSLLSHDPEDEDADPDWLV